MSELFDEVGEVLFDDDIVKHFDFVVQLSRRCFAAGSLWRRDHKTTRSDTVFTSEVGIARYIDRIARSYVYGSRPLLVLIEDDFLVHGSSLDAAIESFVSELTNAIRKLGAVEGESARRRILNNLYARVYMASDNALLLNNDVMARIHAGVIGDASSLRRSSVDFVKYMTNEAGFDSVNALCGRWPSSEFVRFCAGDRTNQWVRFTTTSSEHEPSKVQCLFRLKLLRDDVVISLRAVTRSGEVHLIPAVHHGDMDWQSVQRLESVLAACAKSATDETKRSAVIEMLELVTQVSNLSYRVAFADMLLGQLSVSLFAQPHLLSSGVFNTKQVAEFYGITESCDALEEFARLTFEWKDLNHIVEQLPGLDMQEVRLASIAGDISDKRQQEDALVSVRSEGYRLALSVETEQQVRQRVRAYAPRDFVDFSGGLRNDVHLLNPKTCKSWNDFVNGCVRERTSPHSRTKESSLEAVYASIYSLVDGDQLSITYAENETPAGLTVSQVVGTTEMSLSILPWAMGSDMWKWFKGTVRYCRLNGLSIEKTMKRLGYNKDTAEDMDVLLADAARALEGRRYMDSAVLDWEAGTSLS